MNFTEQEIEALLRRAPSPQPPTGLQATLISQVRLPASRPAAHAEASLVVGQTWFRRWWPVLLPASISLACGVVLWVQQQEINQLRESMRAVVPSTNSVETLPDRKRVETTDDSTQLVDPTQKEQQEITRLKRLVEQLTAELDQSQGTRTTNEGLRAQLAAASGLSPEDLDTLAKAKEKEMSIQCVNNLKQFGLAARIWEIDNNEVCPPDSLSMSNELSTPKILVCPADTNRAPAKTWSEYTSANCSYEYLTPSATNAAAEPTRVMARCPIHGNIGLCDGSVQRAVAKEHPDWLVERDGKLFMESKPSPSKR